MARSLAQILADLSDLIAEAQDLLDAQHAALFGDDSARAPRTPPTPPAATPVAPPAPPEPAPPPVVVPPPAAPSYPVVEGVVATTWLNLRDDQTGETAKQPAYPWAPRSHPGVGREVAGCALPFPIEEGDGADIQLPGGPWVFLPAIEKGPHHTDDPYLPDGRRPRAEGEPGNRAGVDISPAGWALLNGKPAEENWRLGPSARVNVRFHPKGPVRVNASPDAITRARSLINEPMEYELGKEPPGPKSDCSGFVGWCLGYDRDTTGLNTDAIVADAKAGKRFTVVSPPALVGDLLVYPSGNGHEYGHVGLISEVSGGLPTKVIHCSSGNPAGRAVQETDPHVFFNAGALVVRYHE